MPRWYHAISPDEHYLVMTDDMDSYCSCNILQKATGIMVGGFYSFDHGLFLNKELTENKSPIYVDLSVTKGKAFDNHYTFIRNPESVNPNVIKQTYFKKYNGGTLALVATLFGNICDYTEFQWMYLLAVDSFYFGYYNRGGAFRNVNLFWFDMLGIRDYVLPILEERTSDDFLQFIEEHHIGEHINISDDGKLSCNNINITLPSCHFELVQPIEKRFLPKWETVVLYQKQGDKILVSNEVYSGRYVVNIAA